VLNLVSSRPVFPKWIWRSRYST